MQVDLRIRNTDLTNVLRSYAERRLRFALSRFGDRAGRVVVTVTELKSADHGMATSCHISADIRPFGQVAAREADPDLYAAIDRAAGRIGRLFTSRLGRAKDEVQEPVTTGGRTRKKVRKKRAFIAQPRRLLRTRPLNGRFRESLGQGQKGAGSLCVERSNKRREGCGSN
jgi:ribosomal subunit interface protein